MKNFFISLVSHVAVLIILIASFNFSSRMPVVQNSDKPSEVITAMVMDVPPTPSAPSPPSPPPPVIPVKQITPEPAKPEPVVVKKQAIIIPDKTLAQKQKIKEKLQEDEITKQLLADLKKQKKEQINKKIAQQKILKQKSLEADFQKELNALKATAVQSQHMQGVVDKYKALILQAISQQWVVPGMANKKLFAELLIRVAPGGAVLDVQISKSSGDVALDRSARAAVFKASPLPVPTDTDEFDPFRQFVLKVKPENIIVNDSWAN